VNVNLAKLARSEHEPLAWASVPECPLSRDSRGTCSIAGAAPATP